MESKSKLNVWFICDRCTRGYNNVDRLIDHKNEAHPEIFAAMLKEHKKRGEKRKKGVTFDLDEMSDDDLRKQLKRSNVKKEPGRLRKAAPKKRGRPLNLRRNKNSGFSVSIDLKKVAQDVKNALLDQQQPSPEINPLGEDVLYAQSLEAAAAHINTNSDPLDKPRKSHKDKDKLNAFNRLFKQSSKKNTPRKDRSSARISANKDKSTAGSSSSPPGGKFPCPHCSRTLEDPAALQLHLSLHQTIKFNKPKSVVQMVSVPCEQCGREILSAPLRKGIYVFNGKCDDCANAKMTFDIPAMVIKEEPQEDVGGMVDEAVQMIVESRAMDTDTQFIDTDAQFIHTDTQFTDTEAQFIHMDAQFTDTDTQFTDTNTEFIDTDTQLIVEIDAIDAHTQLIADTNISTATVEVESSEGNFIETSEYFGTTVEIPLQE